MQAAAQRHGVNSRLPSTYLVVEGNVQGPGWRKIEDDAAAHLEEMEYFFLCNCINCAAIRETLMLGAVPGC